MSLVCMCQLFCFSRYILALLSVPCLGDNIVVDGKQKHDFEGKKSVAILKICPCEQVFKENVYSQIQPRDRHSLSY